MSESISFPNLPAKAMPPRRPIPSRMTQVKAAEARAAYDVVVPSATKSA